eukprot:TRINITY_DN926_c0_g1_i10.p1 TRINITY_DN926_c0_g1~~TRINITY_DN926_c0_g1_i10.p1  ORF type:complete len:530 (-),score=95.94 TRINITY_DN926_c0_g1_i10:298-1887(-)
MYHHRKEELEKVKSLLEVAVFKVKQSQELGKQFQEENIAKKPETDKKKEEADAMYGQWQELEAEIENKKKEVFDLQMEEEKAASPKRRVHNDKVTEALENARSDLVTLKSIIKSYDWPGLRKMTNPPQVLIKLIEIIWILTADKKDSWEVIQKTMLKKKSSQMLELDILNINDFDVFTAKILYDDLLLLIEKEPLPIIAENLLKWVTAQIQIYNESKLVLGIESESEQKKAEIFDLMQSANVIKKSYYELKAEKDELIKYRNVLDSKCINLHELSQLLVTTTSEWEGIDEWTGQLSVINDDIEFLLADILFASGVLTYFAPFTGYSRDILRKAWTAIYKSRGLKTREPLQMSVAMGNPEILEVWHNNNLLRTDTCIENAFILHHSNKWPILVDPEGVGLALLKRKKRIKLSHPQGFDNVKSEMTEGSDVLIDNIPEMLDSDMVQLLDLPQERTDRIKIEFSDKTKEVHQNFSFTLRTDHYNPIFRDDILASANVINFELKEKELHYLFIVEYCNITGSDINFLLPQKRR